MSQNTLKYRGQYLPSSDAVEAAIVMQKCAEVRSLIHTHASETFTRNPLLRYKVLVGRERYGEAPLGLEICRALDTVDDGFVIMEDHGEVFAGGDASLPQTVATVASRVGAAS